MARQAKKDDSDPYDFPLMHSVTAGKFMWIDADKKLHDMTEMNLGYLRNCLVTLKSSGDPWGAPREVIKTYASSCAEKIIELEHIIKILDGAISQRFPTLLGKAREKLTFEDVELGYADLE